MPFFVALTKKGSFSILVMSTSPPLLSITPKWIAARQILDCWDQKKKYIYLSVFIHRINCCMMRSFAVNAWQTHHVIIESSPDFSFLIHAVSWTNVSVVGDKSELSHNAIYPKPAIDWNSWRHPPDLLQVAPLHLSRSLVSHLMFWAAGKHRKRLKKKQKWSDAHSNGVLGLLCIITLKYLRSCCWWSLRMVSLVWWASGWKVWTRVSSEWRV